MAGVDILWMIYVVPGTDRAVTKHSYCSVKWEWSHKIYITF